MTCVNLVFFLLLYMYFIQFHKMLANKQIGHSTRRNVARETTKSYSGKARQVKSETYFIQSPREKWSKASSCKLNE